MPNTPSPLEYYYSPSHVAKDLVWSVVSFTMFLVGVLMLFPTIRSQTIVALKELAALDSSLLVVGAGLGYVAVAAGSGVLAVRMLFTLRQLLGASLRERLGYQRVYAEGGESIKTLYDQYFKDEVAFPKQGEVSLLARMDILLDYMRLYNPSGYGDVHRTYSLVALMRQLMVYTWVLVAISLAHSRLPSAGLLVLASVAILLGLRIVTRSSITVEYNFLVATSRLLQDLKSWRIAPKAGQ